MGRGRAKAKQTKVARELKYNAPSTDLDALQRELAGSSSTSSAGDADDAADETDELDVYDDDYDDWGAGQG